MYNCCIYIFHNCSSTCVQVCSGAPHAAGQTADLHLASSCMVQGEPSYSTMLTAEEEALLVDATAVSFTEASVVLSVPGDEPTSTEQAQLPLNLLAMQEEDEALRQRMEAALLSLTTERDELRQLLNITDETPDGGTDWSADAGRSARQASMDEILRKAEADLESYVPNLDELCGPIQATDQLVVTQSNGPEPLWNDASDSMGKANFADLHSSASGASPLASAPVGIDPCHSSLQEREGLRERLAARDAERQRMMAELLHSSEALPPDAALADDARDITAAPDAFRGLEAGARLDGSRVSGASLEAAHGHGRCRLCVGATASMAQSTCSHGAASSGEQQLQQWQPQQQQAQRAGARASPRTCSQPVARPSARPASAVRHPLGTVAGGSPGGSRSRQQANAASSHQAMRGALVVGDSSATSESGHAEPRSCPPMSPPHPGTCYDPCANTLAASICPSPSYTRPSLSDCRGSVRSGTGSSHCPSSPAVAFIDVRNGSSRPSSSHRPSSRGDRGSFVEAPSSSQAPLFQPHAFGSRPSSSSSHHLLPQLGSSHGSTGRRGGASSLVPHLSERDATAQSSKAVGDIISSRRLRERRVMSR